MQESDATYEAHENHFAMLNNEEFDVSLLENVPEYTKKIVTKHLKPNTWDMVDAVLDPRLHGQKVSRPRRYFICWRKSTVQWVSPHSMDDILKALRTCPNMDPLKYFWKDLPPTVLSASQEHWIFNWDWVDC